MNDSLGLMLSSFKLLILAFYEVIERVRNTKVDRALPIECSICNGLFCSPLCGFWLYLI